MSMNSEFEVHVLLLSAQNFPYVGRMSEHLTSFSSQKMNRAEGEQPAESETNVGCVRRKGSRYLDH